MGEVDILVNNAGILTEHSFRDATPEEIDLTINVNFTSHFWVRKRTGVRRIAGTRLTHTHTLAHIHA